MTTIRSTGMLGVLWFISVCPCSRLRWGPLRSPPAKRPLNHRDYDSWRTIQGQVLSRDGKFLAYTLFPQEGDGQLVVRNLATGKEVRENAGTPPPAREGGDPEGPPPEQAAPAGPRTGWFSATTTVSSSRAHFPLRPRLIRLYRSASGPDEMPRNSMVIVDLTAMSASRVPDVASFQLPEIRREFRGLSERS